MGVVREPNQSCQCGLDSRPGVLNRRGISPMGEILGIQGGNESV